jgi:N-acetylglucosaminyl-diphospho-decaprenol L-rhamnosyltransferase
MRPPYTSVRILAKVVSAASEAPGAKTSAVIVHYKTPGETVRAAGAVAESTPRVDLIVVDNASQDDVADRLRREVPAARVILEPKNRGFGAACNRGARESSRPYLLFLNSDAYVKPGAIAALEAALDTDPGAAAIAPRLRNPDDSLQTSIQKLPTPWRIFCESSGLAFLSGGRPPFAGHSATREDHATPHAVEAVKGAAILVRRSDFDAAGGFDEGFFLYAEETDLLARWKRMGRRILFEPRAEVVHEGGASAGDPFFGELHASLVRYTAKHHGKAAAALARASLSAGAAWRYAVAVLTPGERGRARRARYRAALFGVRRPTGMKS